jgi:hypothetical protein
VADFSPIPGDRALGPARLHVGLSGTNTAGRSSLSGRTLYLAGQNLTISGSGNTATLSVASQSVQTLGMSAVGNTTGTTTSQTRDARSLSFDGAGIASVGFSNGSIVISASSTQTAPTISVYAVGNTTSSVSSGVIAAGSLSFDGAGAVSVGVSNSSVVISAPVAVASGVVQNEYAIGNTTGALSSSTQTLSSISISGAGGVSVGFSTTAAGAGALVISGATTVASGTVQNVFASGNTTAISSSSSHTLSQLSLSGAGGVSIGLSTTGAGQGIVVISGATTVASGGTQNEFAIGNTVGATSSTTQTLSSISISGAGAVSVGFSTTAAGAGALVISAPVAIASGTVQNEFAIGNTTGATSSTTQSLTSISISGAGGVSVGYATTAAGAGALVISGATTSASGTAESRIASGNTFGQSSSALGTLGSLTVSVTGGISAGFSTAANSAVLMLSVTPPIASGTANSIAALGNTTSASSSAVGTLNSLSVSGAGGVSVGFATAANSGVLIISGATTAASGVVQNEFAIGNTVGASSSTTQTLSSISISGAGGVSVGFSTTAAGAGALVISGATTVASGTVENLFALGNTTALSSSTTDTLSVMSVSGAGGVSVGYSTTAAGAGALVISGPAASGTVQNLYGIGNTTGLSSSTTATLTSISLSGAGAVSVGYSTTAAGAGAAVISAPLPNLSLFAVGNTTVSSSTSSALPEALSFSGAGAASVGYSSNTIIISGGTVGPGPLSMYAVGNTTAVTSSVSVNSGSLTFNASGALSVGFSNSSIVMSLPATSSLVASNGISLSTSGSTISLFATNNFVAVGNTTGLASSSAVTVGTLTLSGAGAVSVGFSSSTLVISGPAGISNMYFENMPLISTTTLALAVGTMQVAPLILPANYLSVNQVRLLASRNVAVGTVGYSVTSSNTATLTASASWGSTQSLVLYSRQGGTSTNSFSSYSSTIATFGLTESWSISRNSGSHTMSNTVTMAWPQGTSAQVSSSFSTSASTTSGTSAYAQMNAVSSNFSAWLRHDIPFGAILSGSDYLLGIMGNSASATATGNTSLSAAAPTWLGTTMAISRQALSFNLPGIPNAQGSVAFPGDGSTSSAGSAVPGTIAWQSLSSGVGNPALYYQMGML